MCRAQSLLVVALFVGLTQSWEIALSVGNRLDFYTSDGVKTNTVYVNSQNLASLAYDVVHNVMLYVDKQFGNDAICGYNIVTAENKCYIERNGRNIQGLVFDPITEILFFTDANEKSINWFSMKPGFNNNNVTGNLLIKLDDGIPGDIAVDNCRGYVYWTNRKLWTTTIERIRFDGLARQVVIDVNELDLHGLAICLQTNKIYWVVPKPRHMLGHVYSADLNGYNRQILCDVIGKGDRSYQPFVHPNLLSVSDNYVFYMGTCLSCSPRYLWKFAKPTRRNTQKVVFSIQTHSVVGTATNYNVQYQIQGISGCNKVLPNNYEKHESEGPFCDHGIKVSGQSFCKCTPGYTGVRCNVSVCGNYCLKGDCSINEEGLPKCRCNAGYSGERCEVNVCQGHCSNNGTCSLNEESQPVCQCKGDYLGDRCEISACENYCVQGNCSINEEGHPACRCNAGYSGERCEVNVCQGHCSNNGTCSLNEESQPVCQCKGNYLGDRCEISACENYCVQGNCSINEEGHPACRCNAGYSGERCKVNVCQGYCSLNEKSQPVCQCKGSYLGDRCEFSACINYCLQGNCSINEEGHPACRCNAGYSGQRCEVNDCHGYCLNNGICSLNEEDEAACECVGDYEGERCDVPVRLNDVDGSQEADQNDTTSINFLEENEGNVTLKDLLASWRKHAH